MTLELGGALPAIIGLSGVARAGKDTVGKILHDLYGYEMVSYSDMLNKALIALNPIVDAKIALTAPGTKGFAVVRYAALVEEIGYEEAKELPEVRRLLQAMGTEVGRNLLGANIWVDALFNNLPEGKLIAITNVRFPNEYDAVKSRGGVVWRVTRPGYYPSNGHVSDTALDKHDFDVVFSNHGTVEELAQKVIRVLSPVQGAYA